MSVIADFTVPPEHFVLAHTMHDGPGVAVEIERVVVRTESSLTPYFRATGSALDTFEESIEDDGTVTNITTLERVEDERFYRARWTRNVDHLITGLRDAEATVMHARASDGEWDLRMLFPNRSALSGFYDHCSAEYDYTLKGVFDRSNPATFGEYEVTPEQRDTLVLALENGYFEVPRRITMDELAEEFGISTQSVSQRLRRGHANVLRNTLAPRDTEIDAAEDN
ncbi:helix-turn-helix domain-containing protein [Haladaptatus caseinilyticus]|uniref:helix-turn-helix domain-containing protein n=1 Tax=Haladaptatus caseinilyticus TaxID=2993314 RepID=UPI00224A85E6|nr:helix-turn-helix domain-containing protein [Haladaptatus caseinilyticus]